MQLQELEEMMYDAAKDEGYAWAEANSDRIANLTKDNIFANIEPISDCYPCNDFPASLFEGIEDEELGISDSEDWFPRVFGDRADEVSDNLLSAAKEGTLKYLAERDQEQSVSKGNATELFEAVKNKDLDALNTHLKDGIDPNGCNEYKETPLMWAVDGNQPEMVKTLLDHGADPNARDAEGTTALMRNVYIQGEGRTDLLGDIHVEENPSDRANITQSLLDAGADINAKNDRGQTALIVAVEENNLNGVKQLLDCGADINARDNEGRTALMVAEDQAIYDDLYEDSSSQTTKKIIAELKTHLTQENSLSDRIRAVFKDASSDIPHGEIWSMADKDNNLDQIVEAFQSLIDEGTIFAIPATDEVFLLTPENLDKEVLRVVEDAQFADAKDITNEHFLGGADFIQASEKAVNDSLSRLVEQGKLKLNDQGKYHGIQFSKITSKMFLLSNKQLNMILDNADFELCFVL